MYQLYQTKEAARILGVSVPALLQWFHKGFIHGTKTPAKHNRFRYMFDVAGYLIKNNINPELYCTKLEVRTNARSGNCTSEGIRTKLATHKNSRMGPTEGTLFVQQPDVQDTSKTPEG